MAFVTLKKVKVTMFNLRLRLALVPLCTKFGENTSNISWIFSGNHLSHPVALNDLCDLQNKVKVTLFKLGLHLAPVLMRAKFGEKTSKISSDN